jgi:hypothetical protein
VSGSTAERLGTDSPALTGQTLTLDALVARANTRFAALAIGRWNVAFRQKRARWGRPPRRSLSCRPLPCGKAVIRHC